MPEILLALGEFRFSVDTAAHQSLARTAEYRWPQQDRLARAPALQFVGPGTETVTLQGVIHPHARGGLGQLDRMRAMAGAGVPLLLADGLGRILGKWCIERVEETQTHLLANGIARRQEFSLCLKRYGEDAPGADAFPLRR